MNNVEFGTDGIRGKLGIFPITQNDFNRIGQACAKWLLSKNLPLNVAIGHDTRESGRCLAKSFANGLGNNVQIISLGVTPTPAISFYVSRDKNISLGVSITASHNNYTDNGLKLFLSNGAKLSRFEESTIESLINQYTVANAFKACLINCNGSEYYVKYWMNILPKNLLIGRKIVIDTANGATCFTTIPILKHLGLELIEVGTKPNGININLNCGSEYADNLCEIVQKSHAWLGFAHDGDGDRLVVIDENGNRVDGDKLLGIIAIDLKKRKKLMNNTIVVTEQSNSGLAKSLLYHKINVKICEVGDRSVFYALEKENANFGGESSGHIILKDEAATGDGLRILLHILKMAIDEPICERTKKIVLYPKFEHSIFVKNKTPINKLCTLNKVKNTLARSLNRVSIRYSGTENKLRFLIEGENVLICQKAIKTLVNSYKKDVAD